MWEQEENCMYDMDNQNALDGVTYSWIIRSCLLIYVDNKIVYFTRKTLSCWKTTMGPHTEGKIIETVDLELLRGILKRLVITTAILR
jgi:hypothetical protein